MRSNSKVVLQKYSLSGGQLNSISPLVVSIGSLFLIRSPTRVLLRFGTYQSKPIVPCLLMNSSMTSSSVLCRFTVGFMAGSGVSGFAVLCPVAATGFCLVLALGCCPTVFDLCPPCVMLQSWLWSECQRCFSVVMPLMILGYLANLRCHCFLKTTTGFCIFTFFYCSDTMLLTLSLLWSRVNSVSVCFMFNCFFLTTPSVGLTLLFN